MTKLPDHYLRPRLRFRISGPLSACISLGRNPLGIQQDYRLIILTKNDAIYRCSPFFQALGLSFHSSLIFLLRALSCPTYEKSTDLIIGQVVMWFLLYWQMYEQISFKILIIPGLNPSNDQQKEHQPNVVWPRRFKCLTLIWSTLDTYFTVSFCLFVC